MVFGCHDSGIPVVRKGLTLYSIHAITPFDALEISCVENIMENGAFALLEQMLHFP